MAKLRVALHGQTISELDLQSGVVYFAGRSDQCQIILPEERGISRQHVKFSDETGMWVVTKLSRFGHITVAGQNHESLTLDNDMQFSVEPFEFFFEFQARTSATEPMGDAAANASVSITPVAEPSQEEEIEIQDFAAKSDDTSPGNFEATRAGVSHLVAYLKIFNHSTQTEEILKLEGHLWTIGRSPSSEIYINDAAISRKHFELSHTHEGYFITDHGSSNGTELNGEFIEPQVPRQIRSGDVINVKNIRISFEIRNSEFDKIVSALPAEVESDDEIYTEDGHQVTQIRSSLTVRGETDPFGIDAMGGKAPGVIKVDRPPATGPAALLKDRKVQIALGIALVVMLYFFMDTTPKKPVETPNGQQELGSRKEVTGEQMQVVREKYELAKKNYFERGNYTFCRDLLIEVHQIVPFFEDSKNLSSLCEQAIDLAMIQEERREKERKKAETENKIRVTVENCRSMVSATITSLQMQECLAPALELDPGNIDAQVLVKEIEERDVKKKDDESNKKVFAQRVAAGRQHYSRANQLETAGRLRAAIQEYNSFLQKNYPGVGEEQRKAERSVASIRASLNQKITNQVNVCKTLIGQTKMKDAMRACDDVLREDPQNAEARELKTSALKQLQREFRSVYEDSRLEESMGNIEAAKQKWNKIKSDSFPGEEFYEKAKLKLKKYEG